MGDGYSFDLKVNRAERHLGELTSLISAYVATHPYEVRPTSEATADERVFSLRFVDRPPPELAMALGDFVHNLRSALDHVACSLVAPVDRGQMSFPIMFQGVWNPAPAGETKSRRERRKRWKWCEERIPAPASMVLRRMQPPDNEGTPEEMDWGLRVIQFLDNLDKHRACPIVATGLVGVLGEMRSVNGNWYPARVALGPNESVAEGPVTMPEDAVDLRLTGTPVVVVDTGRPDGRLLLPGPFPFFLRQVRHELDVLRPFVRDDYSATDDVASHGSTADAPTPP